MKEASKLSKHSLGVWANEVKSNQRRRLWELWHEAYCNHDYSVALRRAIYLIYINRQYLKEDSNSYELILTLQSKGEIRLAAALTLLETQSPPLSIFCHQRLAQQFLEMKLFSAAISEIEYCLRLFSFEEFRQKFLYYLKFYSNEIEFNIDTLYSINASHPQEYNIDTNDCILDYSFSNYFFSRSSYNELIEILCKEISVNVEEGDFKIKPCLIEKLSIVADNLAKTYPFQAITIFEMITLLDPSPQSIYRLATHLSFTYSLAIAGSQSIPSIDNSNCTDYLCIMPNTDTVSSIANQMRRRLLARPPLKRNHEYYFGRRSLSILEMFAIYQAK